MNSIYRKVFFVYSLLILVFSSIAVGQTMLQSTNEDLSTLSELNAQFIRNYIEQDTVSHNEIIHQDFVCIQNDGTIMGRDEYMRDWAVDYGRSGFSAFDYSEEFIRIFGKVALVRSKSTWEKKEKNKVLRGSSIYTDTYIKENGRWWCVQAQITPIR